MFHMFNHDLLFTGHSGLIQTPGTECQNAAACPSYWPTMSAAIDFCGTS